MILLLGSVPPHSPPTPLYSEWPKFYFFKTAGTFSSNFSCCPFSGLVLSSGGGVGSCGSNRTGHARLQFAVKWPSSLGSCCSWRHVHTLCPPRAVNTPNIVYPNLAHLCMLSTQDDAKHYHSELDAETGQNNMVSLPSWIKGFCRERSWGKAKANA